MVCLLHRCFGFKNTYKALTFIFYFCRFIKTFPCVAVYMSSLTNMAIAMDRYRFIVKSQSLQISTVGAALLYPVIVIISLLLAFPIAYKTKLVPMKQLLVSLAMKP